MSKTIFEFQLFVLSGVLAFWNSTGRKTVSASFCCDSSYSMFQYFEIGSISMEINSMAGLNRTHTHTNIQQILRNKRKCQICKPSYILTSGCWQPKRIQRSKKKREDGKGKKMKKKCLAEKANYYFSINILRIPGLHIRIACNESNVPTERNEKKNIMFRNKQNKYI